MRSTVASSKPTPVRPEHRLAHIHEVARRLLDWHQPSALAIEDIYFGKNVSPAMKVGQASGVVMLAAAQRGVDCFAYTPQAIKSRVCGSGDAAKTQVQKMVGTLLGPPEPCPGRITPPMRSRWRSATAVPPVAAKPRRPPDEEASLQPRRSVPLS